jgi:hypothetical protein
MNMARWISLTACAVLLAGCAGSADNKPAAQGDSSKTAEKPADNEAKIKANLAKLNDDDRGDAELQKFCAVHSKNRLGSMGVPVKISVKNKEGKEQDVFLCCKGCEDEAQKDGAKTAARADELNIQGNLAKLSPEDRKLAEAQRFCVVDNDNRLGTMGPPDKYVIKDKDGKEHPVFVCCGGCIKTIKKDEAKTLTVAEELKKKYGQPSPK